MLLVRLPVLEPPCPRAASPVGDLPVHFPAHPQQQEAAGEHQADDGEQLHGDARRRRCAGPPRAAMPQKMTLLRISLGTREAASPTMMALSPASTTSIMMMLMRATKFWRYQSMDEEMLRFFGDDPRKCRGRSEPVHLTRPIGTLPANAATSCLRPGRIWHSRRWRGKPSGAKSDGPPRGRPA